MNLYTTMYIIQEIIWIYYCIHLLYYTSVTGSQIVKSVISKDMTTNILIHLVKGLVSFLFPLIVIDETRIKARISDADFLRKKASRI